jgi:hydroxymethylbilane synthase
MTSRTLKIATRQSPLALAQATQVVTTLEQRWSDLSCQLVPITTQGDKWLDQSLSKIGGKGLFVTELQEAVKTGKADLAVHSMKDLPAANDPELCLVCIPKREDPRDVWIARDGKRWGELTSGAKVGTSSLRRRSQLWRMRRDLETVPLRGNIDTRLRKLNEGVVDAIVLAAAGLKRLGLAPSSHYLPQDIFVPAIGQGALALEGRASDEGLAELLAPFDCKLTRASVLAERSLLIALQGDCHTPLAGHAFLDGTLLQLKAMVASLDGQQSLYFDEHKHVDIDDPQLFTVAQALGTNVARKLIELGALTLLGKDPAPDTGAHV